VPRMLDVIGMVIGIHVVEVRPVPSGTPPLSHSSWAAAP
jgi:hypothetical protein